MQFSDMLKTMVAQEASDLFLTADAAPSIKVFGHMKALSEHTMSAVEVEKTAFAIMSADQREQFAQEPELNLAIAEPDIGRFRVNIFRQRGHLAMVIRHVKTDIPAPETLGLPVTLQQLMMEKRGLLLFVGATGSGKSTSLAALIDYRNRNSDGHIITIEDPIEFLHPHKQSIISQREVGLDTVSYEAALKNTLRQAPDVILIGEIRSRETMEHALAFAETGHLCVSTLHANNANQALDRIINFFPEERHKQLFLDLSLNLRGLISQRLIPSSDGKRAAVFEILLGTPRVSDLIKQGKIEEIRETMEKSSGQGMMTFDAALLSLYQSGRITLDDALANADSRNNLRLKIELADGSLSTPQTNDSGLSLRPKD
ncbi:MAG: PilT/PilU family type 4a pilus ATPase [Pseudohongiella sp.]|uniref:PilT/PilU family type 4a pilus ATPase n=1 Tax=Pseudohongiella sp. TaxID=1979412 RepID=UPI00349FD55F